MGCGVLEARQRRLWKGFCECHASLNAKAVAPDAATRNKAVVGEVQLFSKHSRTGARKVLNTRRGQHQVNIRASGALERSEATLWQRFRHRLAPLNFQIVNRETVTGTEK